MNYELQPWVQWHHQGPGLILPTLLSSGSYERLQLASRHLEQLVTECTLFGLKHIWAEQGSYCSSTVFCPVSNLLGPLDFGSGERYLCMQPTSLLNHLGSLSAILHEGFLRSHRKLLIPSRGTVAGAPVKLLTNGDGSWQRNTSTSVLQKDDSNTLF